MSEHLLVLSDMHLTQEAPAIGLWKRFLQRDRFVDEDFRGCLARMQAQIEGPICLVLNGDIFDFDAVMALPAEAGRLRHVERSRSLDPTEPKSSFKMARIVADHPIFFDALRDFVAAGHRIAVVTGNHDLELYWPEVQRVFRERLGPDATSERLRFEPWFYQHGDVRLEHGHLLDPWCSVDDPRCPIVEDARGERHVQIPFGNIANRYLLNRMGYFNPNCSESYQHSLWGYLVFWVRYHLFELRPFFTAWITGAFFTLRHAARVRRWRGRRGARLPRPYERPVYHRWFLMLRELWLDRVAVVLFGAAVAIGLGFGLGFDWWIAPALVGSLVLAFVWDRLVRRSVPRSDAWLVSMHESALKVAQSSRARHLVLGHSHGWTKKALPSGGFYLNSGNFSASYLDLACNEPVAHSRTFLWLPPAAEPQVLEWRDGAVARLA